MNIFRRSIPRIMMWCKTPGASKRDCLGIFDYKHKTQQYETYFLTSVIPIILGLKQALPDSLI
ncbi:MAG: hypothetical protein K9N21_12835, partial [Deltaproteobacteria bacterium]|nr:hypothetical protein [Deltaproteobacteria bacterium]